MQLLPGGGARTGRVQEAGEMPSRTYGLDLGAQRARGFVDGEEALKQAVAMRLNSWWRAHDIYDDHYGFEAQGLIGRSRGYIRSELKRRLRECLMEDDRVYGVENFRYEEGEDGEAWMLSFRLKSRFGEWTMEGLEVRKP